FLKSTLKEVQDVKISSRLIDSACCLVADEHAMGAHMEKLFKAMGQDMPSSKPILEINPAHPLIGNMQALLGKNKEHPKLAEYAAVLYDQALIMEGQKIKDPATFAKRFNALMIEESRGLL
ncbi:MAG: molecular chaperone HtpG, partial [Candidatus Margulisiibacteriota bacterium]